MAAPGVFDNFQKIRSSRGGSATLAIFPSSQTFAASQNIKKYDILSLNSAGALAQSIALPGSNSSANTSGGNLPIAGVALCDIVTDANGVPTTPSQNSYGGTALGPPVARWQGLEILFRIYDGTATNTQQDDVVIGYSQYQFQRWRGTSASSWWYSLIITTTNGEMEVVERCPEVVGSAVTDNYGLVWCRPVNNTTVIQV